MKNSATLFALLLFLLIFDANAAVSSCPPGEYLVHGHFRRAYSRLDGARVKETNVKPYCKVFSRGYEYSRGRFKKGMPVGWPNLQEQMASWTEEEKERVIEILEDLPEVLLSSKLAGIYRLKKSKDYPNPASNVNGVIVLYDSAFDSSRNLGRIISHELSHLNYRGLSEKERQDYRRAAGWTVKLESDGKVYWIPRKNGYIEEDGITSHEEDYSNNLEHFLFDPDKLKNVTPGAYNWIDKHFGDNLKLKKGKK